MTNGMIEVSGSGVKSAERVNRPIVVVAQSGTPMAQSAGYVCDGVDDQVEINAAINAAAAVGGGKVVVTAGLYLTSSNVLLQNDVCLTVETGAIIRAAADFFSSPTASGIVTAVAKTNFQIRGGGLIDGVTNNVTVNGIEMRPDGDPAFSGTPCSHFRVEGMSIQLSRGHVYHIWSMRSRHGQIVNNQLDGGFTPDDTWNGSESQEGIECYGGHDMLVSGNRAIGIGGSPYNIVGATDFVGETGLSFIQVKDNYAQTCGRFIQVILTSHMTRGVAGLEYSEISGNLGEGVHVIGIDVQMAAQADDGGAIPFHENRIAGNIIRMAESGQVGTARGLFFNNQRAISGIDSRSNVVSDNQVYGCLNTDNGAHVQVQFFSGLNMTGNIVASPPQANGNAGGALLIGCTDFTFSRNRIEGARLYGVHFQGCTDGLINDNDIRYWNQAKLGTAGIFFEAGALPCSDMRVFNNSFNTATLDNVGSLVNISADSMRFDYADNGYVGTGYTGVLVNYSGTNPMNPSTPMLDELVAPGGRLTLVPGAPVMNVAAQAAAITYTPYKHAGVPIFDGKRWQQRKIPGDLTNILANSSNGSAGPAATANNQNYDLFIWSGGDRSLRLTRGPAWTNDTMRGMGAGTSAIARQDGFWVNAQAIINGPAAKCGTYVGTFRTNGIGSVDWLPGGIAVGGNAARLHVWNAYNRVSQAVRITDSTSQWTYATAAWRAANSSMGNRVSFVRGLDEDAVEARWACLVSGAAESGKIGIGIDSTTSLSGQIGFVASGAIVMSAAEWRGAPGIGFHFIQALEWANGNTVLFAGNTTPGNMSADNALFVSIIT